MGCKTQPKKYYLFMVKEVSIIGAVIYLDERPKAQLLYNKRFFFFDFAAWVVAGVAFIIKRKEEDQILLYSQSQCCSNIANLIVPIDG